MDAPLVRAFLDALPDVAPDGKGLARVRACLAATGNPDTRYLVATVVGSGARVVAGVMSSVLAAAGAPTAILGGSLEDASVAGAPIDDALLGRAGTLAASAAYTLHETQPALGELSRREAVVLLALIAFAEANERVALLVDEEALAADPIHAPRPDLVVVTSSEALDRTLALIHEGRPAVIASLAAAERERVETWATRAGAPLLLGGRDHEVRDDSGHLVFAVRGEPYVTFDPVPRVDSVSAGCALAGVLALGVMGIRMREEWVIAGLDALRGAPVRAGS